MPGDHSAISQEGNQRMREDEAHLCLLLLLIQQSLFFSPICPLIALGRDNISNCLALAVIDVGRGWESLLSLSKLSEVASIKLGPLTAELLLLAHADFLCLSFKASSPFPPPHALHNSFLLAPRSLVSIAPMACSPSCSVAK